MNTRTMVLGHRIYERITFQSSSPIRNTHLTIGKVYKVTVATSSTGLPGKLYEPDNDD